MKIALYHNLPSGGAKRTLYETARRLSRHHQLDVYSTASANHTFADLRPFVQEHHVLPFQPLPLLPSPFGRLNQLSRLLELRRLQQVTEQIARMIDERGYDLLLVHPCQTEASPSLLRFARNVPTIYYCQEPLRRLYEPMPPRPYDDTNMARRRILNHLDPLPRLYDAVARRRDQRNTRGAGRVLVNSRFSQAMVQQVYQVQADVSYHGVDVSCFRPLDLPKQPFLLSVGSLTPLKGFDFLIRVMSLLPPVNRPALLIVSNFQNRSEREFLERLAEEKEVAVQFLSGIEDEQLVQLYNQALLTLYAPIREPFGLVPLESMACGTPVVAVREGGVQESVVHEQTGLLVEREEHRFAAAIQTLLAAPDLQRRFARNGLRHIRQQWSWEQAIFRLEQFFPSLN